jgi:hypothetical protein
MDATPEAIRLIRFFVVAPIESPFGKGDLTDEGWLHPLDFLRNSRWIFKW